MTEEHVTILFVNSVIVLFKEKYDKKYRIKE